MSENQMPPSIQNSNQSHTWNMLCHLSALTGFIIPLGNFLGPFLVWQIKKNEISSVAIHGKAALNFQITMILIIFFAGFILAFLVPAFPNLHLNFLGLPIVVIFCLIDFLFPIIAGIKANNDESHKYPFSFNLVK
jgi:uncharacterized Tic20 family protein